MSDVPAIAIASEIAELQAEERAINVRLEEIVEEKMNALRARDVGLENNLFAEANAARTRIEEINAELASLEEKRKVEVARDVTVPYAVILDIQNKSNAMEQQLHDVDQRNVDLLHQVQGLAQQMADQQRQMDAQKQLTLSDAMEQRLNQEIVDVRAKAETMEQRLNQEIAHVRAKSDAMERENAELRQLVVTMSARVEEVHARMDADKKKEHDRMLSLVSGIDCKVNVVTCTASITHPKSGPCLAAKLEWEQFTVTATVDDVEKSVSVTTKTAGGPFEVKFDKGVVSKVEVRYGGMHVPGSPFEYKYRDLSDDEPFGVGVGGITCSDLHNRLLEVVNKLGGLPVIPSSLQCNYFLMLSNGYWKVAGSAVVEVGYTNGSQTITDGLYRPMHGGTKAWPPTAGSLASSTVDERSPNGHPQLFVATAWITQF
eukprot:NODE_1575_length_1678_cov_123.219293_g1497_i0.p1 GENE.NODE_1575_length_1678_cov_123.219293_g1497_i0~~NODE_1575_length_1678_cov_123.219293_g1497_i0.p1  ORF type:complete len:430 (+),score=116.98 NODE_1575_length_1678_cov_123.219293_g1497_i0:66-1355(+)